MHPKLGEVRLVVTDATEPLISDRYAAYDEWEIKFKKYNPDLCTKSEKASTSSSYLIESEKVAMLRSRIKFELGKINKTDIYPVLFLDARIEEGENNSFLLYSKRERINEFSDILEKIKVKAIHEA